MKFRGVMTAIVTPMSGGSIDEAGLRSLVRQQIEGGIKGLIVCGSTGEGATLTDDEVAYAVALCTDEALGRVPIVAGVGARSTHGAIAQAKKGRAAGAAGLLVVTPAYNKPTQAGLEAHFRAVAAETDLPVCLYNVPGRTAVDLKVPAVARLAEVENIVAIKEATGDLVRAMEIRRAVSDDFSLLSGDDYTVMPFMAQGGDGCVSVLSNIAPKQLVEMLDAVEFRNIARARDLAKQLLPLIDALFVESNPTPVKTALAWLGVIPTAELRLPLVPLSTAGAEVLEAAMRGAGLTPVRGLAPESTLGPGTVPDLTGGTGTFTAVDG